MRTVALALLAGLLVVSGCRPNRKDRAAVDRWLLCVECNEGELDAVVKLGNAVTGLLEDAMEGPPPIGRENIRRQAVELYALVPSLPVSERTYVDHFVGNYVASYQTRAATALRLIDSVRAQRLMLRALVNDSLYRPDVLADFGATLGLSLTVVAGSGQNAPIDSFVRVNPTVAVVGAAPGVQQGNFRVRFVVESGGGSVSDSILQIGATGQATARWRLGPGADSINTLRVVALGQTVRFLATGRSPTPRVVFVVQPSSARVGLPISPPVRVAVHDAWGDVLPTFTGTVTLTGVGNPIFALDTLVAGIRDFPGLVVPFVGTGIQIRAAVPGATPAVSAPFTVVP